MKIFPKLSPQQSSLLHQLVASTPNIAKAPIAVRRQNLSQGHQTLGHANVRPAFSVDDRVELRRSVPDTQYRAGQKGVIIALHGNPPKVAEVEIDDTFYADVVSLKDLEALS